MTVWEINLNQPWFDLVRNGKKSVEVRLNKGSVLQFKAGDTLKCYDMDYSQSFCVEILAIKQYPSLNELLAENGLEKVLPGVTTISVAEYIYRRYFRQCTEERYGLVAIDLRPEIL